MKVGLEPENHEAYHALAALLVQSGDLQGYRLHCARELVRFAGASDPNTAERMAKDCLILPPPAAQLPSITKLADVAVAAGSTNKAFAYFQFAKGLAELRAGHFGGAVDWLQPVTEASGDIFRTVQAMAALAIAQNGLKQTDHARVTLTKAIEFANERFPKKAPLDLEERWNDWYIAQLLMREAEALIQPDSTDAQGTK